VHCASGFPARKLQRGGPSPVGDHCGLSTAFHWRPIQRQVARSITFSLLPLFARPASTSRGKAHLERPGGPWRRERIVTASTPFRRLGHTRPLLCMCWDRRQSAGLRPAVTANAGFQKAARRLDSERLGIRLGILAPGAWTLRQAREGHAIFPDLFPNGRETGRGALGCEVG